MLKVQFSLRECHQFFHYSRNVCARTITLVLSSVCEMVRYSDCLGTGWSGDAGRSPDILYTINTQ